MTALESVRMNLRELGITRKNGWALAQIDCPEFMELRIGGSLVRDVVEDGQAITYVYLLDLKIVGGNVYRSVSCIRYNTPDTDRPVAHIRW